MCVTIQLGLHQMKYLTLWPRSASCFLTILQHQLNRNCVPASINTLKRWSLNSIKTRSCVVSSSRHGYVQSIMINNDSKSCTAFGLSVLGVVLVVVVVVGGGVYLNLTFIIMVSTRSSSSFSIFAQNAENQLSCRLSGLHTLFFSIRTSSMLQHPTAISIVLRARANSTPPSLFSVF